MLDLIYLARAHSSVAQFHAHQHTLPVGQVLALPMLRRDVVVCHDAADDDLVRPARSSIQRVEYLLFKYPSQAVPGMRKRPGLAGAHHRRV
jgi:hypothetical protein